MARGQAQLRGTCAGCGGWSKSFELAHTDVEALMDVSVTDASSAQACAAAWTCTRVSALHYLCVYVVVFTVHMCVLDYLVCVCVCAR